ncbi:hypothetical protein ACTXPO_13440 [Psychrobacter celer]|uniref:hypothetical protein n=1 Tax=Psychrobacter celer TaxID=306572 RepID=UPI003FD0D34E
MNDFLTRCNELADALEKKTAQQQIQIERLTAVNRHLNKQNNSLQRQIQALQNENSRLNSENDMLNKSLKPVSKRRRR